MYNVHCTRVPVQFIPELQIPGDEMLILYLQYSTYITVQCIYLILYDVVNLVKVGQCTVMVYILLPIC